MVNRSEAEVSIRVAARGEAHAIARFLSEHQAHNPKANPAVIEWQYGSETFGPTVTVLAEANGAIVGHYTLFGIPSMLEGTPIPTAHGADLVVHPTYRGNSVATDLLKVAYGAGREAGYGLVVSNPNYASLKAFTRAGLRSLPSPTAYFLTLHPRAIIKRFPAQVPEAVQSAAQPALETVRKLAHSRGSRIELPYTKTIISSHLPGDAASLLSLLLPPRHSGIALNDERWWKWRYEVHPFARYRFIEIRDAADVLVGLGVIAPHPDADEKAWLLYEHATIDQETFTALLRSAAAHAESSGAHMLLAGVSSTKAHSALRQQLRRAGFLPLPRPLVGRALHLGVADLSGEILDVRARDWTFSFGDQDHL